jgi:hypothetical protein
LRANDFPLALVQLRRWPAGARRSAAPSIWALTDWIVWRPAKPIVSVN